MYPYILFVRGNFHGTIVWVVMAFPGTNRTVNLLQNDLHRLMLKLNSYSNASMYLSLCHMLFSVFCFFFFFFWGQKCLTDRSISKHYHESDVASGVEQSSTSWVFHAHDTGFYWSSENAMHERFIASSGVWVWMKMLQLIAK